MLAPIAALMLLAVSQAPAANDPVLSYYDQLKKKCVHAVNPSCCRASVNAMRKENMRERVGEQPCYSGTAPKSLICPSSLNWCSPQQFKDNKMREYRENQ